MKIKTKKSITKRFRVTKSGKMLRRRQNSRHLRRKKSAQQRRKFKRTTVVHKAFAKKFKKLMNL